MADKIEPIYFELSVGGLSRAGIAQAVQAVKKELTQGVHALTHFPKKMFDSEAKNEFLFVLDSVGNLTGRDGIIESDEVLAALEGQGKPCELWMAPYIFLSLVKDLVLAERAQYKKFECVTVLARPFTSSLLSLNQRKPRETLYWPSVRTLLYGGDIFAMKDARLRPESRIVYLAAE